MLDISKYVKKYCVPGSICFIFGVTCTVIFYSPSANIRRTPSPQVARILGPQETQAPQRGVGGQDQRDWALIHGSAEIEEQTKSSPTKKPNDVSKRKSPLNSTNKNLKTILYWNDSYGRKDFGFGFGQEPFIAAKCRVNTCYATHNKTIVPPEEADAIIWHLRAKDNSLPSQRIRSPHTYYVFYVAESAVYTYANLNIYNGVFNWTMTYRLDSDFPMPYGGIKPPSSETPARVDGAKNFAAGKTKLAAWFVSNCYTSSDRENLVKTLKRYINVDMYGHCGQLECPRNKHDECLQMLERDYKFYFAFENSLCTDYITEKFFLPIKYDVVPVVYGLGYDKLGLPEHSYIDVLAFGSLKELADHLLYLDANDTAYSEYFKWKTMGFSVADALDFKKQGFCDICWRLHEAHDSCHSNEDNLMDDGTSNTDTFRRPVIKESYHKVYSNLYQWFVAGKCKEPKRDGKLQAFIQGRVK